MSEPIPVAEFLDRARNEMRGARGLAAGWYGAHLLAAIEAVLELHRKQDKPIVTTNICGAHDLKSLKHAWARDEVAACPACFKVERYVCVTCRHECPDNDEWPCVTYTALAPVLRDAQGG